jgi:DNA-binding transcriptional LysR family regulator
VAIADVQFIWPRLRFEGDDFRSVLALVASGLGIALMPRLAIQQVLAPVRPSPPSPA